MEAIILAGGFGTRLKETVPDIPKPMAPISGTPFLEILLRHLSKKGIRRVILSLGYKGDLIKRYFGYSFSGVSITYSFEDSPLGTGGATRLAMTFCMEDHTFVLNGDTFLDLDFHAVESQWKISGNPIIVGLEISCSERYGRLLIKENRVIGFSEKKMKGPGIINTGHYLFNCDQLFNFPINSAFSLENDFLNQAISNTSFDLFFTSGFFLDIGTPEDYSRAQVDLFGF